MPVTLYHQSDPSSARTNEELSFLHAVEFSDVMSVRRLIRENPTLNVDVIDALGRTALRLAVRNENKEVLCVIRVYWYTHRHTQKHTHKHTRTHARMHARTHARTHTHTHRYSRTH